MAKYKVVGPRTVADTAPGHTVELDLPEANIDALVKAGHIVAVKTAPPKTAKPDDDDGKVT